MIFDYLDLDAASDGLRACFRMTHPATVIVPSCVDPDGAAALRARVLAGGLGRFEIADRGRWQTGTAAVDEALCERLRALASRVAGRTLATARARIVCLGAGDYALFKGDDARDLAPPCVEVTVDFSAASTGEAEITYSDGKGAMVTLPQLAGSLCIVERTPGLVRGERYLTHRVGRATVWRLRVTFAAVARG